MSMSLAVHHAGGKGTPRRKVVKKSVTSTQGDDRKLQAALKKLGVQPITGVEEVNMFKEDGNVLHFNQPRGESTFIQSHRPWMPSELLCAVMSAVQNSLDTSAKPSLMLCLPQSTPLSPPIPSPSMAPARPKSSPSSSPVSSTNSVPTHSPTCADSPSHTNR